MLTVIIISMITDVKNYSMIAIFKSYSGSYYCDLTKIFIFLILRFLILL